MAEDIVQESFIRIVQGIKSYRSGTNGYAWVCRIVRNTAINYVRSAGGRRWQSLDEFDRAAECSFEEKSHSVLLAEQLMRGLSPERAGDDLYEILSGYDGTGNCEGNRKIEIIYCERNCPGGRGNEKENGINRGQNGAEDLFI